MLAVEVERCSRCRQPFETGERRYADPCCGAPDCDGLMNESHFRCLSRVDQEIHREY
jgi:hypothetical protein